MKFGEFYIVQACKDASKKNHPVEAKKRYYRVIDECGFNNPSCDLKKIIHNPDIIIY